MYKCFTACKYGHQGLEGAVGCLTAGMTENCEMPCEMLGTEAGSSGKSSKGSYPLNHLSSPYNRACVRACVSVRPSVCLSVGGCVFCFLFLFWFFFFLVFKDKVSLNS